MVPAGFMTAPRESPLCAETPHQLINEHGKPGMYQTKQELRQIAKEKRIAIPPAEREKMSAAICSALLDILDGCSPVLVYVSKPPEVNTGMVMTALIARTGRVIVPIIQRETTSLRLSYLEDLSVLVESTFHVPEPIGSEIPASPKEVSVAVIPVLGFDMRGNRLGYGAGYYDRFLAQYPDITRIGLAFSRQEIPVIPCDENDVKMDLIITEKGIYRCGKNPL